MATFVRLAKMTEHGSRRMRDFARVIAEADEIFKKEGVKIIHAYATLGPYDFVVIADAPDEKTMMRASAMISSKGNVHAETFAAIPISDFRKLFGDVD